MTEPVLFDVVTRICGIRCHGCDRDVYGYEVPAERQHKRVGDKVLCTRTGEVHPYEHLSQYYRRIRQETEMEA